ncbi:AMP-binding protein [Nocardia sp. NPDC052566]|uniref:non-ribosomal peptide synthetase n=1 Tax=Nocardia sp. NPDC052566 TaxID=3364330 RepID=UPI0037C731E3
MDRVLTVRELLANASNETPDAPALLTPDGASLSYRSLLERVDGVGGLLASVGIRPSDRVAIVLPGGTDLAVALLGTCSYAVAAPLYPHSPVDALHSAFEALGVTAVLTTPDSSAADAATIGGRSVRVIDGVGLADPSRPLPSAPQTGSRPEDVALVLRTSGTTGAAKTVPLRAAHLTTSARTVAASLRLDHSDCSLNVMPLFHVHGFVAGLLAQLAVAGTVICTPGLHAGLFPQWMEQLRPTWYTATPTMHHAVLSALGDGMLPTHTLRFVRSASAPLPPALTARLEAAFGVPVIEAYGMTEAAHQITSNPLPPASRKPASVGIPTGCEVAVMTEPGRRATAGQVGDVVVRGPSVFDGYVGGEHASAWPDDWFDTGDRGYLDVDGYLFLVGRSKEMINRGGETIAPREVDEVLLAHPAVAEAVAFAIPDDRLGETVAAAVVLVAGATINVARLREFAANRLPAASVPERIAVVAALPTGPTGKVQRIALARRLAQELNTPPVDDTDPQPAAMAVERVVADVWAEVLAVAAVDRNDQFRDLGGDSMLAEHILTRLQDALGIALPAAQLLQASTVAEQAALIARLGPGSAKGDHDR